MCPGPRPGTWLKVIYNNQQRQRAAGVIEVSGNLFCVGCVADMERIVFIGGVSIRFTRQCGQRFCKNQMLGTFKSLEDAIAKTVSNPGHKYREEDRVLSDPESLPSFQNISRFISYLLYQTLRLLCSVRCF